MSPLGSANASATVVKLGGGRGGLDQLDPHVVRVEDERDARRTAGEAVRFLGDPHVLAPHLHQETVEVGDLEREVVELLAGLELVLPVPVGQFDPCSGGGVLDERDLRVVLRDRSAALELEPEDFRVELEALVHVPNGDRGVQESHAHSRRESPPRLLNLRADFRGVRRPRATGAHREPSCRRPE